MDKIQIIMMVWRLIKYGKNKYQILIPDIN